MALEHSPLAFDHVGIRVADKERSLAFYGRLGFSIDEGHSSEGVAEIISPDGARLNLIFNGVPRADGANVLLDLPDKWPGYTHAAFIVRSMAGFLAWADREQITITEGPVDWGRRITCFIRDPDGNVLEFNELKASH